MQRDLADTYPNGEFRGYFAAEWVSQFIKDDRKNINLSERSINTARWAKEQVKRQMNTM